MRADSLCNQGTGLYGKELGMEGSLLSHIADKFIPQYENVANSSLSHLLNRYAAARDGLKQMLELDVVPNHYVTEMSATSHGRPDISALDANNHKAIIIEGKFWANLTDNQPTNYLKELAAGGKLLFLAPDRRLESLQSVVSSRLGKADQRVVIRSWTALLRLIEGENGKTYDSSLAADLVQLRGLCQRMDEEGMPPLSMEDLDPMNGRLCYQLADLIDDCNERLRAWGQADFKGMKSGGLKKGYGFYFKVLGIQYWLGFSSYDWFKRKSHTPIWLYIYADASEEPERIYSTLKRYDAENVYRERDRGLYGIVLQPGMDRNQAVQCIVDRVLMVLSEVHQRPKSEIVGEGRAAVT
jgi:hypothetical protein